MKIATGILVIALGTASVSAQVFKVLFTFVDKGPAVAVPVGGLVYGNWQYLYGATREGGTHTNGAVFRAGTNGTFVEMANFDGTDGKYPSGGLAMSGSILYGTTTSGGASSNGVIFKATDFGGSFSHVVLKDLAPAEGIYLNGGLALSGSTLYGTTRGNLVPAAPPGGDMVFKIGTDGSGFQVLSNLTGMNPRGGLLVSGITLYGSTRVGGSGYGVIYRLGINGGNYAVVKAFAGDDGANPNGNLVLSGGTLYGVTASGGSSDQGTVFRVNTNGSDFATLKSFPALASGINSDGATPVGGLVLSGGKLYGATFAGGSAGKGVVFRIGTNGTGFAVLKQFPATTYSSGVYTNHDGANPNGDLVMSAGTLYGATSSGGGSGRGVLFSLLVPPEIEMGDGLPGVRSNRFEFYVSGAAGQPIRVEACTNLASDPWTSIGIADGPFYFSDIRWTNYNQRFYRVRAR